MKIIKEKEDKPYSIRFSAQENGIEVGRAFLFIIHNNLHEEPYGLMEDVFVEEDYRGQKIGSKLVDAIIEEAQKLGCRKLVGQSRYGRDKVYSFYERKGFKNHGYNFRIDFI